MPDPEVFQRTVRRPQTLSLVLQPETHSRHAPRDAGRGGLHSVSHWMGVPGYGLNLGVPEKLAVYGLALALRWRAGGEGAAEVMISHVFHTDVLANDLPRLLHVAEAAVACSRRRMPHSRTHRSPRDKAEWPSYSQTNINSSQDMMIGV